MRTKALTSMMVLSVFFAGCDDALTTEPKKATGSRFDAPKRDITPKPASTFCEAQFPAGEGGRRFQEPAEKPVPGATPTPAASAGAWRWVNLWATWCLPCVEEMPLLGKWQESLKKDGVPIELELWSVDDEEKDLVARLQKSKLPGRVRWLKEGSKDLAGVLENLGVDKGSPIPVHALIDGRGQVRCVRVGNVHDEDYGAIKGLLLNG